MLLLPQVRTGCKFVYLTTDVNDYQFDDGSVASVSENPEPLPRRTPPAPSGTRQRRK